MDFKKVPIGAVKPNPKNPRVHEAKNIDKIVESIKEFGFTNPILVDKNLVVVAGHGRLKACKKVGMKEVPVIVLDELTDIQRDMYIIADNQLSSLSRWDEPLLHDLMKNLEEKLIDNNMTEETLRLTGFDEQEILEMLSEPDEIVEIEGQDDFILDPEEEPVVDSGDIWILGNHRIICGDSTQDQTYKNLLQGEKADMLLTDPPYNVAYEGKRTARKKIINDKIKDDNFLKFLTAFTKCTAKNVRKNFSGFIFFANAEFINFFNSIINAGWQKPRLLIWVKNHFVITFARFKNKFEPIFYIRGADGRTLWRGQKNQADTFSIKEPNTEESIIEMIKDSAEGEDIEFSQPVNSVSELIKELRRGQPDIMKFKKPHKSTIHPTMKPVELLEHLISLSSYRRQIILDPFSGSGSSLIACEKLGRHCRAIELDPQYCQASIERWEKLTGGTAVDMKGETLIDRKNKL